MANYTHQIQTMLERVALRLSTLNQKGIVLNNTRYKLQILEISILKQVEKSPGISINEVGLLLQVDRVEITKSLRKLSSYKLIDKTQSKGDKRSVILDITEKGMNILKVYSQIEKGILDELLAKMTINDEKAILKFLSTISQMTDSSKNR